jgi:hypothetical protein
VDADEADDSRNVLVLLEAGKGPLLGEVFLGNFSGAAASSCTSGRATAMAVL